MLPLDDFLISDKQLKRKSYASALVVRGCLEPKGIESRVPYVDFDAAYADYADVRSTLTRRQAARLGYHRPTENPPAGIEAWERFRTQPRSERELAATTQCFEVDEDEIPSYPNDVLNFTSSFATAAFQGSVKSSEVESAAEAWSVCMAPHGIEDLPGDPQAMPSESIRQKYDTSGGRDGETLGPITQAEIDLALADVDCRESSGYQQALYDAIWEREARLLEENQAAFEEQRAAIEKTDAEIDRIIAQYATAGGSS